MQHGSRFGAAALLIGVLIVSGAMAASLGIAIKDTSAAAGKTVDIPVEISGAKDLGSMDLLISYNASVLSPTTVDKGSLTKGMISADTKTPGYVSIAIIDSAGITGSGPVAVLHFNVVGPSGASSPLTIENALAYDVNTHIDIPVTPTDGMFTVKGESGGGSIPGFGAFAGILSLLGIGYLFGRERKG